MAESAPSKSAGDGKKKGRGPKPKMTKEERRVKYTEKAHARRDANMARIRDKDLTCYRCRRTGHSAENCKFVSPTDSTEGSVNEDVCINTMPSSSAMAGKKRKGGKGGNICYKCGSIEHRIQLCPKIKSFLKVAKKGSRIDFGKLGELPYAECYLCNKSGHLSSYCPENKKGLYPLGGSCRQCGSVDHLAIDCPKIKVDDVNVDDDGSVASSNSVTIDRYLEDTDDVLEEKSTTINKKKRKVVTF
jgi:zinc finger CCHC domain-containing protein 9